MNEHVAFGSSLPTSAACLVAMLAVTACTPERPNVVVLLIDSLRADHLGCYGYDRDTSPNIDALARESLLFAQASAQSSWTKPSIPTLFTSLYPIQHRVYEGERRTASGGRESDVLADDFTTLAELFRNAGYATAAFVHNAQLPADHGFDQGFDVYTHGKMDAAEINRRFLEFADGGSKRPFLAYLHYLDVHWPFQPEEPFRSRFPGAANGEIFERESWRGLRDRINDGTLQVSEGAREQLRALHDAGIAELDWRIGELLEALEQRSLTDRTIILLTSDHGEELFDHGRVGHGRTLFSEVIEIPLMIRLPGRTRSGRIESPARLVDVLPTLLDAAGIETPAGLEGESLLGGLRDAAEVVSETRHGRTYRVSLRQGDWKYIRTYRAEKEPVPDGVGSVAEIGLQEGMRIKAKGLLEQGGVIHAAKLSLRDAGDRDVEVSGPITAVQLQTQSFDVLGFRVDSSLLMESDGSPVLPALDVGDWVKVEGDAEGEKKMKADDIELLSPRERKREVEGIIGAIAPVSEETVVFRIGGMPVRAPRDTRVKGLKRDSKPVARDAPPRRDPFSRERLLSQEDLDVGTEMFHLASDPNEQRDVRSEEPERLAAMRAAVDVWIARAAPESPRMIERRALDADTIDQLRALGYVE